MILPEGLENIPNQCFVRCESLKGTVVLPKTLKSIGQGAFFSSRISTVNLPEGLETIGEAAFYGCNLKNVTIPNSCLDFPESSHFSLCKELKEIRLPEGLQEIPTDFVDCCLSLEHINIPTSTKSIQMRALHQCRSIKNLQLPEGLTTIGTEALWYLDSLEEIEFPSTLLSIGMESCEYWANIKKIYCKAIIPPVCIPSTINVGDTPFGDPGSEFYLRTPQQTPIYVPVGTADIYRNTFGWNYFENFIETADFPSSNVMEILPQECFEDSSIYDISGRKTDKMIDGNLYIKAGKKFIYNE